MKPQSIPKIILDTDPGGDDIFAFLWLLSLVKKGLAELVAVTAVGGNVAANRTFLSASQVLNLIGFESIEVGRGVRMNVEPSENAAHIHGDDGMGNLSHTLPEATHSIEAARSSDQIIVEHLNASPGEITLIAIGPLTNLAAAEQQSPGILKKAREIVIMGGAFHCPGNATPQAEFNIWFNPEAAALVFNSREDIVVMPLDVTTRLILTSEMTRSIVQLNANSKVCQFLTQLCDFMVGTALGFRETAQVLGFLVHDAATLGYLFYPETMLLQRAKVRIETKGEWTRGQTLIDHRKTPQHEANAWIAQQVNAIDFFTHFIEDLKDLVRDMR